MQPFLRVCPGGSLCLRVDYLFIPLVCFLAIVPLEQLYHFGGEQLAMYCGKDIGDLIVITLNKYLRVSRV